MARNDCWAKLVLSRAFNGEDSAGTYYFTVSTAVSSMSKWQGGSRVAPSTCLPITINSGSHYLGTRYCEPTAEIPGRFTVLCDLLSYGTALRAVVRAITCERGPEVLGSCARVGEINEAVVPRIISLLRRVIG